VKAESRFNRKTAPVLNDISAGAYVNGITTVNGLAVTLSFRDPVSGQSLVVRMTRDEAAELGKQLSSAVEGVQCPTITNVSTT